ncbi:MAG: archease [Candidatus Micrarchaeaceae archaeon]
MGYRFIEDIAISDIAFEADGATIDGLFSNAAKALTAAMIDNPKSIRLEKSVKFEVSSRTLEMLLFSFLNKIIFYKDSMRILFSKFEVKTSENKVYELRCTAYGEELDAEKQKLAADVKAVTMHMLRVWKENDKWHARVILDV